VSATCDGLCTSSSSITIASAINQGLGNELIDGVSSARGDGGIRRRPRLGELLNYHYRAA
jgi:hypothetical protein